MHLFIEYLLLARIHTVNKRLNIVALEVEHRWCLKLVVWVVNYVVFILLYYFYCR